MQLPPEKREGLTVDLYNAPHAVWPELPTTVANAQVGQFGFLLLSDAYITEKTDEQDPSVIAESGGKYPKAAGFLPMAAEQGVPARRGV
jgi:hypothetical protein